MQKIRVTKTGKTGDQRDYSLVQRQVHYIGEGDKSTPVKNTMGAIPREEANIEVEGGETVIGDVNRDGFLEHMTFVGKRHSEGGMPVNIPDGSFIFSDTKKLKIKDKEVLKNIFGLPDKKGGYTPAEIAKRYQINKYIQDLKNEDSDAITKRSSTEMLKNNMEKLGQLALIQESMKGFPDGIPAIAESVMAGMQGSAEEQPMQEARYGGLAKAQQGLNKAPGSSATFMDNLKDYSSVYMNQIQKGNFLQRKNSEDVDPRMIEDFEKLVPFYGKESDGFIDYITTLAALPQNELNHLLTGYYEAPFTTIKRERPNMDPDWELWGNIVTDPMMIPEIPYFVTKGIAKGTVQVLPYAQQAAMITAKYGKIGLEKMGHLIGKMPIEKILQYTPDAVGRVGQAAMHVKKSQQPSTVNATKPTFERTRSASLANGAKITIGLKDGKWYDTRNGRPITFKEFPKSSGSYGNDAWAPLDKQASKSTPNTETPKTTTSTSKKAAPVRPATKKTTAPKDYQDMLDYFEEGGSLDMYQKAGEKSKEIAAGTLKDANGKTGYLFYTDTEKIVKDEQGNVVARAPFTASGFKPHPGDKNPSVNPVTGKTEQGWNKSKYTSDQIDELARARGYNGPKDNKILQQWIINHPEFSKVVNQLHDKYKMPYAGKEVDGYWGVRWDDALQSIPEVPKENTTTTQSSEKEIPEQPVAAQQPRKQGPWWLQDIVNFVGASTEDINRYEPSQAKIDLTTPGYVTEDPTRRLAANQEQMSKIQAQTENTVDGNVGLASMIGASGQGFANAANVLAEVENRNVNIVNQAYANAAGIQNQEAQFNEQGRQKYIEDMATLNQQYDNSRQLKKWRQIAAFNNGVTNDMRKKQMEQILFPQVYTDPITGNVDFSGEGRAWDEPNTYAPAYMAPGATGQMDMDTAFQEYDEIYNAALPKYGEKKAGELAMTTLKGRMMAANRNVGAPTQRQMYNNMVQQGMYLPAPMMSGRQQEFGGTLNLPWEDID